MKKFLITILIAAAAAGGVYYFTRDRSETKEQSAWPANEQAAPIDRISYQGQDGKNAFEILTAVAAVEFKSYDFGVFVESINGVKPDSQHFWKLYINGKESQVGADQAQTKNGDLIEWKLEEIAQ